MKKHRYTKEQIRFIHEHAEEGKTIEEISQLLNNAHKLNVTPRSVQGIMYRHKIRNRMQGYATRFRKCHKPWNKDKKGVQTGGKETRFKKGQIPPSYKPVGSESVHEGYVWVKVADPNVWVKKHHLIWTEANGPIQEGSVLLFADGNKMNVTLSNLLLTSRRVLTSVIKRGLNYDDPDLNRTVHTLANLELTIKDIERKKA